MVNVSLTSDQRGMDGLGATLDRVNLPIGLCFGDLLVVLACAAGRFVGSDDEGGNPYRVAVSMPWVMVPSVTDSVTPGSSTMSGRRWPASSWDG